MSKYILWTTCSCLAGPHTQNPLSAVESRGGRQTGSQSHFVIVWPTFLGNHICIITEDGGTFAYGQEHHGSISLCRAQTDTAHHIFPYFEIYLMIQLVVKVILEKDDWLSSHSQVVRYKLFGSAGYWRSGLKCNKVGLEPRRRIDLRVQPPCCQVFAYRDEINVDYQDFVQILINIEEDGSWYCWSC